MKMQEMKFGCLTCLVRFPDDYEEGQRRPVILALHGAGYRGTDLNVLRQNPFFTCTEQHAHFPFVMVAPQCHENTWFDLFESVLALARHLPEEPWCDPERISVMGASMGGYATWQVGMSIPEMFCAILPICGGGMYWNTPRLKNVPVWAFHGALDPIVLPEESRKMTDGVNAAGGHARLTVYPEDAHNSWTDTYSDPKVFQWLEEQKLRRGALDEDPFHGEAFG